VAAAPGQFVIDTCAGAGGKTLALAAAMQGRGRLVAADRSLGRLDRAGLRLRRAGAFNVERRDSRDRKWLKRQAGRADRVLVDAPCSGIGSWRRIPDARWRLQEPDIPELVALQRELLDEAARLVAPGGRLVYVTCSVLPVENREQIDAFLSRWPGFRLLPVPAVWSAVIGGRCPVEDTVLQLTPLRHGTGGFFVAILERRRD
jgi:16S rRNA (cytosine967-C5)-methyltransferase